MMSLISFEQYSAWCRMQYPETLSDDHDAPESSRPTVHSGSSGELQSNVYSIGDRTIVTIGRTA